MIGRLVWQALRIIWVDSAQQFQSAVHNIRMQILELSNRITVFPLWHYRLWSFKSRDTKLEIFLHKNQHTQRKLLNFDFCIKGDLLKKGHHSSNKNILKKDFIKKYQ